MCEKKPGLAGQDVNHYASTLARWDGWELAGQNFRDAKEKAPPDAHGHAAFFFVPLPGANGASDDGGALRLGGFFVWDFPR